MSNTGVNTQTSRSSLVVENRDLIADIEQDRFISATLQRKVFIYGSFPQILEQAYQIQNKKNQLTRFVQVLICCSILVVMALIFEVSQGASLISMLGILPVVILLCVGILMQKSPLLYLCNEIYLVMFAALFGYAVQGFMIEQTSAAPWLFVYGLCMLAIAVRVAISLPALLGIAGAAGIVAIVPGQLWSSGFVLCLGVVTSMIFWLWREDSDRRQFLQFCMAPTQQRQQSGVKATERARQLVVLDKKTGLANNTSFMRFFINEWRRAFRARQSVSLILIRLDVTIQKLVEHGHLDLVITELQRYSRRPGDMVGSMDERSFAVLLSNTDINSSRRLAESLLQHLHGLNLGKDGSLKVCMGVASTLPMPNMSHNDLYAKASEALHSAEEGPDA